MFVKGENVFQKPSGRMTGLEEQGSQQCSFDLWALPREYHSILSAAPLAFHLGSLYFFSRHKDCPLGHLWTLKLSKLW